MRKFPLLAAVLVFSTSRAHCATPLYKEVFVNFGAHNTGSFPNGRLVQANDGNFYGTSQYGGVKLGGTAFKLTPAGQLSIIFPFDINPSNFGNTPKAGFCIGADGLLYGSTTAGSCNTTGCLFKMSTKGAATFLQCNDVEPFAAPYSHNQLLKASDGTFYTALYDTDPQMQFVVGIIQHLATDGSVLFSIQMDRPTTGAEPDTRLTEGTDHNIYGVAPQGGANNMGTVFRVTPSGTIAVLHPFNGTDGNRPHSPLVQASDGNFYGTTSSGGSANLGTVFRITPGGVLTTLLSFTGSNGSAPQGGVTLGRNGLFYGTTNLGGPSNDGTFYQLTLQGALTTLASFNRATTGSVPVSGITLGRDGYFYGITISGGDYLNGTAYRISASGALTKLASFGDPEPYYPSEGVIQGRDGNLYGTAAIGGIFKITPAGQLTLLAAFDSATTGYDATMLAQGADGYLRGATRYGGANNGGTIFKCTTAGTLSAVAQLNSTIGLNAWDFLLGKDGNFYGLTGAGGPKRGGTIFKLTSAGVVSRFAALDIGPSGGSFFRFMQDTDGNFYGTASQASDPTGLAFKVSGSGVESTLAHFDSYDIGVEPAGGLTRGLDGNFYGTTETGGAYDSGSIFRLAPAGAVSVVHSFTLPEGNGSLSRLLRMSDGSFFGTTFENVNNNNSPGLIFRITTDGTFKGWPFFDGLHGSRPQGTLTLASDGYAYGITEQGGIAGGGVVYRFTSSPPQLTQFSPASGPVSTAVVLRGRFLAGTSSVTFNGVRATKFTIDSSTKITATVPRSATSGPITIKNPLGTAVTSSFTVTP